MKDLAPVWDLESIFAGGSGSAELEAWLERLGADIGNLPEATLSGENAT